MERLVAFDKNKNGVCGLNDFSDSEQAPCGDEEKMFVVYACIFEVLVEV